MGYKFWIKRALKVYISVALILFIVELIKENTVQNAIYFALLWSLITTVIFISTRVYYLSKGVKCHICQDSPEQNDL